MQKRCIFGFSRFSKKFFAQNTYLYTGNNSRPFPQLCACFLRRFWNFDARDFEATHSASLLPNSKLEIFKKISLVKFSTNFAFPVSPDLTDTFLFWKIFCGCMFRASWARVCVWRKFSKILKKREISRKGPLLQKSKNFLFPVSLGCPETFLFWKIFSGSKFWVCWIRICVAVITNNCSSLGLLSSPSVQF